MPYITNDGVRIHYEVEGKGQPLMLQHGFAATLWTWRDFSYVKELGKEYRLVLVDARGHGESDKPHDPASYRPEVTARDYISILDALDIEKTHYMGYSMGGRIGLTCLTRYAMSRLNSLILGGISPRRPVTIVARPQDNFTRMLKEASEKGMDVWLARREKMLGWKLSPAQRARQLANDPKALLTMRKVFSNWSAEDILSKINIPMLFFVGDTDPSYAGAKEDVKSLPDAEFVTIPGCNHDSALMRSELVLPHVKKFLAEASKGIKI